MAKEMSCLSESRLLGGRLSKLMKQVGFGIIAKQVSVSSKSLKQYFYV